MTDQEIVAGLLARDEKITREFFFVKCRPLMYSVINKFFPYKVNYDELINELYVNIMANDGQGLRTYSGKSSIYQWLKTVAYNYFSNKKKRENMIDDTSKEPETTEMPVNRHTVDAGLTEEARLEIEMLLPYLQNERRRLVIQKTMIEGVEYKELAQMIGTSEDNLYNIKRRALMDLVAIVKSDDFRK